MGVTLGLNSIITGCPFTRWMQYVFVCYAFSFLILFGNFYRKTYTQSIRSGGKKSKSTTTTTTTTTNSSSNDNVKNDLPTIMDNNGFKSNELLFEKNQLQKSIRNNCKLSQRKRNKKQQQSSNKKRNE